MSEGAPESPDSARANGNVDSQRDLSSENTVMPTAGDKKLDEAWGLPLNVVSAATTWRRKTVAGSTAVMGRLRRRQQGRVDNPRIRPAEAVYRGLSGAGNDAGESQLRDETGEQLKGKPDGAGDRRNRFMKRKSSVLFEKMGDMPPTLPIGHFRSAGPLSAERQGVQVAPATTSARRPKASQRSPQDEQARTDRAAQVVSLRVLCEQWLTLILSQEDLRSDESVVRAGKAQVYAVEHLIPTVTMCMAHTLKRAVAQGTLRDPCAGHGALIGLAEELMRRNPRYSVGEVSVYARAMRGTLVEIKSMGEALTTEHLAAARKAAQRRMEGAEEATRKETAQTEDTKAVMEIETEAVKEIQTEAVNEKETEVEEEKETEALKEKEPETVEEKPSEPGSLEMERRAIGAAFIIGWSVGVMEDQKLVITRNHILRFFEDHLDDDELNRLFAATATIEGDSMFAKYQSVLQDADNDVALDGHVAMNIFLPFVRNCNKDFLDMFSRRLEKRGKAVLESTVQAEIRAKIGSTFSALQAPSTGLVNRHKVLTLMEDFYTYVGSDVKKHLTCPSRFPVVDILESTDTGQETGGLLLDTIPEAQEQPPSLIEMMKQGRPTSQLLCKQQGVADSSKKVLARARLNSRRSVAGRYGATQNLSELRTSGEPSPQPLPMSPIDSQAPLNELTLGADQFTVMVENFLGEELKSGILDRLLSHFKDEYKETDAEIAQLAKMAQQNARHAAEMESIDKLFDMLDHEQQRGFVEYGQLSETLAHWALAQPSITEDDINNFLDLDDSSVATLNRVEFQQLVRFLGAGYEKGLESVLGTLGEAIKLTRTQQKLVLDQRKWLRRLLAVGSCCTFDPEPAFKAAFDVVQENNEKIEDGKRVSVAASLFDKSPQAKNRHLQFVAATSADSYLVGERIPKQDRSAMYKAAKTGTTVYVADINTEGCGVSIFNPERKFRETCAFMAVPIPHAKTGQALGVLSMDTMDTMDEKGETVATVAKPFAALEMRFAERIANALGHILCDIECRKKTVIAVQEAMRWACRCLSNVKTSSVYTMETLIDTKEDVIVGYALRKAITFLGTTPLVDSAARRIQRKTATDADKSYLFRCVDTALPVSSAASDSGTTHIAFPLRDSHGVATAVLDIEMDRPYHSLETAEQDRLGNLLRQLTVARFHASDRARGLARRAGRQPAPDLQFLDNDIDASSAFMSVMLDDVNNALLALSDNDLKEVRSYNSPPHGVDTVMCIALSLLALDSAETNTFSTWEDCKRAMHDLDVKQKMLDFKPLEAAVSKEQVDKLDDMLLAVVIRADHLAAPLVWIHEWCVSCLSLMTCKLRVTATLNSMQASDQEMQVMSKLVVDRA